MLTHDTLTFWLRPVDPAHALHLLTTYCPSCGRGTREIQACEAGTLADWLPPPCHRAHPQCATQQLQQGDTLWEGTVSVNGYAPGPIVVALTPDSHIRFGLETPLAGGPPQSRYCFAGRPVRWVSRHYARGDR